MSIRSVLFDGLKSIPGVGMVVSEWPKSFTTLPLICFQVNNRIPLKNFTYDQESEVTVLINLWGADKVGLSELALEVSAKMAQLGYRRTMEMDNSSLENDLKRIDMRFKSHN